MTSPNSRKLISLTLNVLLAVSIAACCGSLLWEFSTEQYLSGFADAIVPANAAPSEKVEDILAWMAHGPSRSLDSAPNPLFDRDPRTTLNYRSLLNVCGSATNAFVNVARRSGLRSRRLLLFDDHWRTTHVVAEVQIDGRWIVVDPVFHLIARDSSGRLLTREDLRDPALLKQATAGIENYSPEYSYRSVSHIRLARIPLIGKYLQAFAQRDLPSYVGNLDWTLPLERESFAALLFSFTGIVFFLLLRRKFRRVPVDEEAFAQPLFPQISRAPSSVLMHHQ